MDTLKNKKLFLLDMDGTIYLGDKLFQGALDFLNYLRRTGRRYMFLTNNSSKSVDAYIKKLGKLGITTSSDDFFISTQATVLYLKENYKDKKIYAFGTRAFKKQLIDSGLRIVDNLENGITCLVLGFDTELNFQKLEDACILLNENVDFIATNPDLVCPTEFGYVPDCGSICDMLYNATKRRPLFIGKPEPTMINLAIEKTGFQKSETILIGDRLYTDIASGIAAGISTALVLTGEATVEDAEKSDYKSEFVFKDINEIYKTIKRID